AAGLSRSVDELERRLVERPIRARKPSARVSHLFTEMTAVFCDQPNLGRAVIRSLVAGSTFSATPALGYFSRVLALVLKALRGPAAEGEGSVIETERAVLLLQVWFAGLVSWLSGAVDADGIRAMIEM